MKTLIFSLVTGGILSAIIVFNYGNEIKYCKTPVVGSTKVDASELYFKETTLKQGTNEKMPDCTRSYREYMYEAQPSL